MIAWVDIETTGLSPKKDHILEVAFIITDDKLVERATTSVVIKPLGIDIDDPGIKMPLLVREMHEKSGLIDDVKKIGVSRNKAQERLYNWLIETFVDMGSLKHIHFAGNSVAFDRDFMREQIPKVVEPFSHRLIDCSTLTELAARWAPAVFAHRPKQEKGIAHRAFDDIRNSIDYLRYYRASGFLNFESNVMDQAKEHNAYFKGRCPFADCDFCAHKP